MSEDSEAVTQRSRQATVDALHEHGPVLLATARIITHDEDEAEDLVQMTFEIAFRRIDSLREPAALDHEARMLEHLLDNATAKDH